LKRQDNPASRQVKKIPARANGGALPLGGIMDRRFSKIQAGRFAGQGEFEVLRSRARFDANLHFWAESKVLLSPAQPWEFFKLGNCGSPIETEAGWLVLSHGVGAMRKYCLGAFLLDLNDPARVIGRLREPLLSPNESEREGYVSNIVYTCGALLHGRELIIPYAMSDSATSFATVSLDALLAAME
jgi:predicted GH43/DUF377 family glycosyl hydrolase